MITLMRTPLAVRRLSLSVEKENSGKLVLASRIAFSSRSLEW